MYKVIKRDGSVVDFDITKIKRAIIKAFESVDRSYTDDIIDFIVLKVTADFEKKLNKDTGILGECYKHDTISVEDIQDSVETVLAKSGYDQVAKSFILYREKHAKMRSVKNTLMDYKKTMEQYLGGSDWRVKENSTVTYSVGGLILNQSGAVTANYWLSEIYDAEIANAHRNCDMHIHDLCMLAPYCCGHNLKQLITEGLNGVPSKVSSSPATHLSTLCNQMVNYLGIEQNEWAGAQAFSSFDTLLAPFVKKDNLSYKEVKQCIQSFVYGVNTPSRWGTQSPFSNITIDWNCPEDLKDQPAIVGGVEQDFTYGDCKAEMDMINKAFMEIMTEGDYDGKGFAYPIPTYSITKEFDWSESENLKMLFGMAAKYGIPYFSNYVNSDMKPSDVRSMCCRLRLDLREIVKKNGGGYFGSGDKTGSTGVVTLNFPRLGYLAKDKDDFYKRLDNLLDIAARSLAVKRETVTQLMENGLYPYTKRYIGSFDTYFNTIATVGMNEMCLNAKWINDTIASPTGKEFTIEVLKHILDRLPMYQEKYGYLFNLESAPAESTCYRLAKHDKERFPDIKTAGTDKVPYYTNSSNLPVGYTGNIYEALEHQDPIQTLYTSGTVFHAYLGEALPDWKAAATIIKKICENYRLPYITLSPTFSVCPEHGYIKGEHYTCPICESDNTKGSDFN